MPTALSTVKKTHVVALVMIMAIDDDNDDGNVVATATMAVWAAVTVVVMYT